MWHISLQPVFSVDTDYGMSIQEFSDPVRLLHPLSEIKMSQISVIDRYALESTTMSLSESPWEWCNYPTAVYNSAELDELYS